MKRWTYGVMVAVVVSAGGCGDSKEEKCTLKRKAAADAVVAALPALETARRERKAEVDEAQLSLIELAEGEKYLEARVRLFEQSMDCLVYKDDCCKRLGKVRDRRNIWGIMLEISKRAMPIEVAKVLVPMQPLENDAEDLQGASAKDAETFCTASRTHIARIRAEAPAAWKTARMAIETELAERKARHDLARRRVKAIGEWADAIRKNQKATIPADRDGAETDGSARDAVEAYNAACF